MARIRTEILAKVSLDERRLTDVLTRRFGQGKYRAELDVEKGQGRVGACGRRAL